MCFALADIPLITQREFDFRVETKAKAIVSGVKAIVEEEQDSLCAEYLERVAPMKTRRSEIYPDTGNKEAKLVAAKEEMFARVDEMAAKEVPRGVVVEDMRPATWREWIGGKYEEVVEPRGYGGIRGSTGMREGAAPDARRKRMLQLAAAQGIPPAVQQSSGFLQTAFNGVLKLLFRKVGSKIIREAIKREQGLQALLRFNSPLKAFNMGGLQSYLGTKGARVARAVRIGIRVVRIVMMVAYVIPKGLEEFDVMELAAGTAADGYDRTHDAIVGIEGDEDEELAALAAAGAVEEELSVDDEIVYF
eukprot:jgi/Mesvir1/6319/Mv19659-RA.1